MKRRTLESDLSTDLANGKRKKEGLRRSGREKSGTRAKKDKYLLNS